jgi:hypothetical protein
MTDVTIRRARPGDAEAFARASALRDGMLVDSLSMARLHPAPPLDERTRP